MQHLLHYTFDSGVKATIGHSTRTDGDLSPSVVAADVLHERRKAMVDLPWHSVRQIHSDRAVVVDTTTQVHDREIGDALVTNVPGCVLAVHAGDCAPVGFIHPSGVIAAAHAGWAGLERGVLEATVRRINSVAGASGAITAAVGPHIRADRYEFGTRDLQRLARRFGDGVVARTLDGAPAFDLTTAIALELRRLDVGTVMWSDHCTAADPARYWSHRARQEAGRIAMVAWLEER